MKNMAIKVLLVLSSLLVTIFAAEACVRLYIYINPTPTYDDNKLGWRVTENFHSEHMVKDAAGKAYRAKLTTHDHGFRLFGDPGSAKEKVLVIGDSFTYAADVSDDKTYYSLLAKKLDDMEFFAYGGAGYGTLQEYMILDEFIDLINPHIIILQLCSNDIYDNFYNLEKASFYNIGKTRPYMDLQGNIYYENPSNWLNVFGSIIHSRLLKFMATKARRLIDKTKKPGDFVETVIARDGDQNQGFQDSLAITKRIMHKIKSRAPNSLIFAFCADGREPYHCALEQAASAANLNLIGGVSETIKDYEQKGFTVKAADKGHWNPLGHKIVADKIYNFWVGHAYVQHNQPKNSKMN